MAAPIVEDLLELFPDVITIEKVTRNGSGTITAVTETLTPRARIVGKVRKVIDAGGNETVSSVQAYIVGAAGTDADVFVAGVPGATVKDRFTLPARFSPSQPMPIAVLHVPDENGPHHEVVFFR